MVFQNYTLYPPHERDACSFEVINKPAEIDKRVKSGEVLGLAHLRT